jgi:hypothetical protein
VNVDEKESDILFEWLDGLPLAVAQAAAYLRESGISVAKYVELYEQQWRELMELHHQDGGPLLDYPERSVWTTWAISYSVIRARSEAAANLLLLWACLDNKDIWYDLLATASSSCTAVASYLSEKLSRIASNEVEFLAAIRLLRSYSLIEDMQDMISYSMHPVVHKWAFNTQEQEQRDVFMRLAVMVVGWAVPSNSEREYARTQRRLLGHAQRCLRWIRR